MIRQGSRRLKGHRWRRRSSASGAGARTRCSRSSRCSCTERRSGSSLGSLLGCFLFLCLGLLLFTPLGLHGLVLCRESRLFLPLLAVGLALLLPREVRFKLLLALLERRQKPIGSRAVLSPSRPVGLHRNNRAVKD